VTIVKTRPITDGFLAMLRAHVNLPTGDHEAPEDTSDRYLTVYGIEGGEVTGPYGSPHEEATVVFQTDSSGHSRDQAQWVADKVREAVLTAPIPMDGWLVVPGSRFQRILGQPLNEGRDETGDTLFTVQDEFAFMVAPG
jgi:hypothetical protein